MFIVTPYLAQNQSIYGIYAICTSVTIFLNYADLGFLAASQKYAAEAYAQKNRNDEVVIIGFGTFILGIMIAVIGIGFLYLSFDPGVLIGGLVEPSKIHIARQLMLILALSTPFVALQRMANIFYAIRLESYIAQRISLISSAITICFAFLFFSSEGHYNIVGYFLFSQALNGIACMVNFVLLNRRFGYSIKSIMLAIRFDLPSFLKTKNLAFSGLFLTATWILYYELDQVAIARFLGSANVALYAIGLTFLSLFRNVFGMIYSPFAVRANHFVGNNDQEGLIRFADDVLTLTAPFVLIPTLAFSAFAKPIICSWVGEKYVQSIAPAQFLALYFAFSFISYVASMLQYARENIKVMNIIGAANPVLFWGGVLMTYRSYGLISFAAFKLVTALITEAYSLWYLLDSMEMKLNEFLKKHLLPLSVPCLVVIVGLYPIGRITTFTKSRLHLAEAMAVYFVFVSAAFLAHYLASKKFRFAINNLFPSVRLWLKNFGHPNE